MGIFSNTIWYEWDAVFRFYPLDALVDSISPISSIAGIATQNSGIPGSLPGYALQYFGRLIGLSVIQLDRLVYLVPWALRGIGMYALLSVLERSNSRSALLGKFLGALLYQFAPLGEPFSSNISSVTAGTAPLALAIYASGAKAANWVKYSIASALVFTVSIATGYSIVFLPFLICLYTIFAFRRGRILRGLVYILTTLGLCLISSSYFFLPYLHSVASSPGTFGFLTSNFNQAGAIGSSSMNSIQNLASKNNIVYNSLGLLEGVWNWGSAYTVPWILLSLATTTGLAYSYLLGRRDRITFFLAVLGTVEIVLITTLEFPYVRDIYLFGFQHLNAFFVNPIYFLYGIWLAEAALFGLVACKLLAGASKKRLTAIAAVLLILVLLDSVPMIDGAMIKGDVSPTMGFPIPQQYYQLHDLLNNAPVGARLMEVPAIGLQVPCNGQDSPGFTWASQPGCFDTWIAKLVPRQVEVLGEDPGTLSATGSAALFTMLAAPQINFESEASLMQRLNVHYMLVHKDLTAAPSWVQSLGPKLIESGEFNLVTSNPYFDLYSVNIPASAVYLANPNESLNASGQESHLRAYWALDEGAGTLVNDSSLDNANGEVVGHPDWISNSSCFTRFMPSV